MKFLSIYVLCAGGTMVRYGRNCMSVFTSLYKSSELAEYIVEYTLPFVMQNDIAIKFRHKIGTHTQGETLTQCEKLA